MALAASLSELHAEARCHVCQAFLQEPVTLECGHNCCGSCLQQRWEHLHNIRPGPICLHPCTGGHPQSTHLEDMTDVVQQILCMRENSEKEQEENEEEEEAVVRHQQALSLFCEDILELLCGQCTAPRPPGPPPDSSYRIRCSSQGEAQEQLGEQLEEAVKALERNDTQFTELKGQLKLQKQNGPGR